MFSELRSIKYSMYASEGEGIMEKQMRMCEFYYYKSVASSYKWGWGLKNPKVFIHTLWTTSL